MNTRVSVGLLVMFLLLPWSAAEGQRMSIAGMRGVATSASIEVPALGDGVVYTVPTDRVLLLTQACFAAGGMSLSGGTFGRVVTADLCTEYVPGVVLQPSEVLTCSNANGVAASCMITGILGPVHRSN